MRLTRQQAIKAKCMDCSNESFEDVVICSCTECPLFRYRLGHEDPKSYSEKELREGQHAKRAAPQKGD